MAVGSGAVEGRMAVNDVWVYSVQLIGTGGERRGGKKFGGNGGHFHSQASSDLKCKSLSYLSKVVAKCCWRRFSEARRCGQFRSDKLSG